jgi:DNA-binding transcriptional MerR regulator
MTRTQALILAVHANLAKTAKTEHSTCLDLSLAEVRRLLDFAGHPVQSCAEVNALVDDQTRRVRERIKSLNSLERQLVSLRKRPQVRQH